MQPLTRARHVGHGTEVPGRVNNNQLAGIGVGGVLDTTAPGAVVGVRAGFVLVHPDEIVQFGGGGDGASGKGECAVVEDGMCVAAGEGLSEVRDEFDDVLAVSDCVHNEYCHGFSKRDRGGWGDRFDRPHVAAGFSPYMYLTGKSVEGKHELVGGRIHGRQVRAGGR